jgi:hypothetical protein
VRNFDLQRALFRPAQQLLNKQGKSGSQEPLAISPEDMRSLRRFASIAQSHSVRRAIAVDAIRR